MLDDLFEPEYGDISRPLGLLHWSSLPVTEVLAVEDVAEAEWAEDPVLPHPSVFPEAGTIVDEDVAAATFEEGALLPHPSFNLLPESATGLFWVEAVTFEEGSILPHPSLLAEAEFIVDDDGAVATFEDGVFLLHPSLT